MNVEFIPHTFSHAAPEELKINMMRHAYGIPKRTPVFSWVMRSGDVNEIQTAYRIYIARRLSEMQEQDYLLDTGWIATDECNHVTITGLDTLLGDQELYYWAVQTRNKSGDESPRSEATPFVTAVGDEWEGTHGIWSGDTHGAGNFAFLRTEFRVPDGGDVERAVLSVTATSPEPARQYVYRVFLNGAFAGMGPARLDVNDQQEEILYYNTFDVTALVHDGVNALGAICYATEQKAFLCQLTVFYKNGTKRVILNSARDAENFRSMDGRSAFGDTHSLGTTGNYVAAAEDINALLYPFGFDRVGFEGQGWENVRLRDELDIENEQHLAPYPGEPVGLYPQGVASVTHEGHGRYRIDLGQEIVGGLRLTFRSPSAQTVHLFYGEELNEDGSVRYRMRTGNEYKENWTLREGEQTIESFGMKTFRYVDICGYTGEIAEEDVCAVAVRREFDAQASYFTCPNDTLCYLYDTFKYAICTTNQDLYVDSQSRERVPYEGDTFIEMLSSYTYENDSALARFSVDYLCRHRTWPAEYALLTVHLIWTDYMYTGNYALLSRAYGALRSLVTSRQPDGATGLYHIPNESGTGWDAVLVDWPAGARDGYYVREAYYNTVYNAFCYLALCDMAAMAEFLGKSAEAIAFRGESENLGRAMIDKLYDANKGAFRDGLTREGEPIDHFAQHATALAIWTGVCRDPAMLDAAGRWFVGQEKIQTSIYGAYFLIEALYRAGFGAYATALLADSDVTPGAHNWLAALRGSGATIAPEAWCAAEKPNMSLSHPWGTAPAALMVRGMFGILPTSPGFRKFSIHPQIGDLPYASIRVPTARGSISVTLAQNSEAYEAEITVPANTTAEVFLPAVPGGTDTLFINSQKSICPIENKGFHIRLGSGTHRLLAQ